MAQISADDGNLPDLPPLWAREGDIAVVNVFGSLVPGTAGYWRLYGVTGYSDITDAVIEAVSDDTIKAVALRVESPGGSTTNLAETADLLVKLGKIKPLYAHSETCMASAGYWIASAASTVSLNPSAQAGSIGCVAILTSFARAYTEMGIDREVVRSGQYKALGSSVELISQLAKDELQSKVDDLAAMFDAYVGKRRGRTASQVNTDMGQGRMFLGKRALDAGLVDKLMTYDQIMRFIEKS
jgi:signal peptide peptidase SppA